MIITMLMACVMAASAFSEGADPTARLLEKWTGEWPIRDDIQAFSPEGEIMAALVVVSEQSALSTAVDAIVRIEDIDPEALSSHTPTVAFKAIGTAYTYDVRLTPPEVSMPHYYVEISASFADHMVRYHVLNEDGTQTLSIKFFSGPGKEIREQNYEAYMAERAGG